MTAPCAPVLRARVARYTACLLVFGLLGTICRSTAWPKPPNGSTPQTVVRVEEDWELVISEPDVNSSSPQINCLISPVGHADSLYATYEVNHKTQSTDIVGGLQLQVWLGESPVGTPQVVEGPVMSTTGEAVRWTQVMALESGTLTFELAGGDSISWGKFGSDLSSSGGGQVFGQTTTTTTTDSGTTQPIKSPVSVNLTDLNAYSPQVSVDNSGISCGANRVQSLLLKKVRLFFSDGSSVEDTTTRTVYPQP